MKIIYILIILFPILLSNCKKPTKGYSVEEVWAYREDKLYKTLFPEKPDKVLLLAPNAENALSPSSHYGTFEIPPSKDRPYYTYVTSGMSNPTDEDLAGKSGYGIELVLHSKTKLSWAPGLLNQLTMNVVDRGVIFDFNHRIPLPEALHGSDQMIHAFILFDNKAQMPSSQTLPSGQFKFLTMMGVTEAEYKRAQKTSSAEVINDLLLKKRWLN